MLNSPLLLGLAAGVCSALLFVAGAGGSVLPALVLFLLAPLPTFLAGLGWGPRAVLAAGAGGIVTSLVVQGPRLALLHAVSLALPVAVLCWLVHLRRSAPPPGGLAAPSRETGPSAETGPSPGKSTALALEWYPAGRLLAWIAVMAGCLSVLSVLTIGSDAEAIGQTAQALIERQAKTWATLGGRPLTEAELATITAVFVRLLPVATAMSWMFMMLANLWLAGRILKASGRLLRPWPQLAALDLPPLLTVGLAVALTIAFGSGLPALLAGGFVSAFVMAYAVVGLAVLHWITHGRASRSFTLAGAYVSALLFAPYGTLPIALIGLLEPILRLRSRAPGPPPAAPGPGGAGRPSGPA